MGLARHALELEAESQRRLSFLLEVSTLLASSLDYEVTLTTLARLSVPALADICVIDILGDDGSIRRVAAAHADPAKQGLVDTLQQRFRPDPSGSHPVARALRTGQSQVATEITEEELSAIAVEPAHRLLARALQYTSYMTVPLVARGRTLGAISLVSGESRRRYTAEDVALAEDLARRAGLAVDNARLYAEAEQRRREAESAVAELRRLQTISDVALASLAVEDLLGELLIRLRGVLGVDTASVLLIETERQVLAVRATSGIEEALPPAAIPLGAGFSGRVALAHGPVVADDDPELGASGIRSLLGAPLIVHNKVTGVIRVGSTQPRRFSESDARVLQLVADRAALAIENAHLYQAERSARNEAEAANRAKDHFLAMLAHELRNPLAPIRSGIYLIGRRLGDDPLIERTREIIERQLGHLTRLLDDLLDVARITQGKIELVRTPLDLAAAVTEAMEAARSLTDSKGHTVRLELPERMVRLEADPTRLVQIIDNLLSNAAKYTPAKGVITVSAGEDDGWAVVSVKDTGIGIRPELLPRVFDLFSQLEPSTARTEGGLGVGLTLVRRLAELHGGRVTAHSEGPGMGSEFVVYLPAGARAPHPTEDSQGPIMAISRRILIVEDNADAADMLRTALELDGHQVWVARDGQAGVAAAVAEPPDIMLVDIGLPGLDGYDVAREVRSALGRRVRLVALTGYGQPADRQRAAEAGFDAHLVKPLDPDDLKVLIQNMGD